MPDDHRTALITGGARRVGAAITRELHGAGLNVVIHCNSSRDQAAQLAVALNETRPDSALVVRADLTEHTAPAAILEPIRDHWGRLDLLVHNASLFRSTAVGSTSPEDWNAVMSANLAGPFFLSQAAAPMLKATEGAIVSVVDIHGQKPLQGFPVYSIAKAGLEMMTRSLALELAPGVRVNGIAPGAILWPEPEPSPAVKNAILERTALKRRGEPRDIAEAVRYLGLEAAYVTGEILIVDGGRSLHM